MDDTTFGKSQAAKDLVYELNKRPALKRRVANFIRTYQIGFEHISDIVDRQHKFRIATMWRKEFIDKVDFEPVIDKFIKNVMIASYRDFIKSINS